MHDETSSPSKQLSILVDASNPELLEGLEAWLRLGLISETQVKRIGQIYLTCPLPEVVTVVSQQNILVPSLTQTGLSSDRSIQQPQSSGTTSNPRNLIARIWQGFKDELSVRWLLFLGLFLVIVSSTVLAATQWEKFTTLGQYLILLTYTIIFWGVGFWLSRKENLTLTSQTLQSIAFLLIPINFWAMDAFKLWSGEWGWGVITLACVILTTLFYQYSQSRHRFLVGINFLGLCYLNWGWQFSQFPIIAVYIALIVTTIILKLLPSARRLREFQARGLLVYGLTLLLIRAIFVVHLPIQQLGLAIGVCGWLLQRPTPSENEENSSISNVWEIVGIVLLFLGWLVSVGENLPWQATIISILGLQFFNHRLRRNELRLDLLAIFVIGLQEVFLISRLIPESVGQDILNFWMSITQNRNFPDSIYSIILFPYLSIFVGFTDWLFGQNKSKLAKFGEKLSLFLGVAMTVLSLLNLTARSLNFFLCTLLLIYFSSRRQPIRVGLIYLTHWVGLLAVFSTLDLLFPSLDKISWINIVLGLTGVEWAISTLGRWRNNLTLKQVWYQSCWFTGFGLAFISYILLLWQVDLYLKTQEIHPEVLGWLLVPLSLTGVASRSRGKRKRQAAFWSCFTLFFAQILILWQADFRLFSLGFGAGLMLFNTYYLRRLIAARIQIGFTLALQSIWMGRLLTTSFEKFFISPVGIISDGITLILLWLLNLWLKDRPGFFSKLFAQAAEGWAIFLCVFNLLSLTLDSLGTTVGVFSLTWHSLVTTFLIGAILIYRYWQNINYWVVYGVAWVLELLVIQSVVLTVDVLFPNVEDVASVIAIINTILAFFTLGFVGWLSAKSSRFSQLMTLQGLPLIIALMGIGWRWGHFTAYTGLLTVGTGLIGVMVGYRVSRGKSISYLAVAGISLGIYEGAIYQMRQTQGELANNIMILALITGGISLIYRLLSWFCYRRGYEHYLNLSRKEIKVFGHIHWAIASCFRFLSLAIVALTINVVSFLSPLTFIASLILPSYALIQGRSFTSESSPVSTKNDFWVYLGLFDLGLTALFARLIWSELEILDPYKVVIVCGLALILYYFPWKRWQWNDVPWQRIGLFLPGLMGLLILQNFQISDYLNFFIIAVFYGLIALTQKNIRWTYISLICFDYSLLHWLLVNRFTEELLYALIIGLSVLYVAQFDPSFKNSRKRKSRHYWRILGNGVICLTALLFYQETGITPAIISLIVVGMGLGLQIRAFLFIGTITFIMTGIYQLVIVSFEYGFIKWIIGLILGIILITIAANFERRREQILTLWQTCIDRLNQWQ
ncbi:conserved hypothetical protein [Gloeothece citriformis PCC 7424]|uniref:DUF2157 domain-containing protein n=1 Tax=Gloeothece citriformis (strain PCC 7424) TaxID=65393 RepID=B7K876_GLOC7|nr:hypothetical protein [Gloeothece citriformis]ACK69836.1 conserved hypothetical protein [Gloeothece citriformis PCC 7424]